MYTWFRDFVQEAIGTKNQSDVTIKESVTEIISSRIEKGHPDRAFKDDDG